MQEQDNNIAEKTSRRRWPLLAPSATVFISSFCIMVLELVASRLVARHLGSSLYTWTSVIGVVLMGITIGNYIGGRIADRFSARKTLSALFGISSLACVLVVLLNNLVGGWIWLWEFSWPVHIFAHVAIVFLLPSVLLGTISPVVAKMALDRGLPTGRTIGDIYAWAAAGSIAGTFFAGFYLIEAMGTVAIIWTIGATLLLIGILYWARLWVLYIWAAIFIALMTMGMVPTEWAGNVGAKIALREKSNPNILYENETQYCYVAVKRVSDTLDKRAFYFYSRIFSAVTKKVSGNKNVLTTMVIGGGGYVFPRYIEKVWPGSRVDVAEIDPGVTKAAMEAFGLPQDTAINTISMDARNYVDDLVTRQLRGETIIHYDFIYEDAINDYSVPFQLVTKEFNDKIAGILTDNGVYMVNLIDIFERGLFLGAMVNTLQKSFPYVHVIAEPKHLPSDRSTFVIIAAKQALDLEKLIQPYSTEPLEFWHLDKSDMAQLKINSGNIFLTDNYAPVENLIASVVRQSSVNFLIGKYLEDAKNLVKQGKIEESLRRYQDLLRVDPAGATKTYNDMGMLLSGQGKIWEAIEMFRKALQADEKAQIKSEVAGIHHDLGLLLKRVGRPKEAKEQFNKAIDLYRRGLIKYSNSPEVHGSLGDALAENGEFEEASTFFAKAVSLNPVNPAMHMKLVQSLEYQGRFDEAIAASRKAYQILNQRKQTEAAAQFENYTKYFEHKKSQKK
jgi:tetratricopeptide (TPR) repeat protein/MFS family permease